MGDMVTLTTSELWFAGMVGMARRLRVIAHSYRNPSRQTTAGWTEHVEGACAEAALAKWLNRWWAGGMDNFNRGGDVAGYEVKSTARVDGCLIVATHNSDARVYVLAIGRAPSFKLAGWIVGRDAKRAEWLRSINDRPAAYFVPQAALHPMNTLPMEQEL